MKRNVLSLFLAVFLFLIVSNFALAQKDLELDYPEIEGTKIEKINVSLPVYLKYIFNFIIGIAGLLCFISLVYGGFLYLTSAGSPAGMKNAKDQVFAGILGLIIISSSYLILTTINPQLVFFKIPGRVIFPQEPIVGPAQEAEKILYYSEIPLGGLIEELFSKKRMERINFLSEEIKAQSEKVKNLSQELKTLTENCQCLNCEKGSCQSGDCNNNCDCISNCHCAGDPYGSNDPCGIHRQAIDQKRQELKKALSQEEIHKGLKYWQEELDKEINGSDKEKIIGFGQIYNDLLSAEELIKKCSFSFSKNGESQILLNHSEFWQYRTKLKEDGDIERAEPQYPFNYVSLESAYYATYFYCAEFFQRVSLEKLEIEEDLSIDVEEIEEQEIVCSSEIAVGETCDNAQELGKRMLNELDNINKNALQEIADAESLANLSEQCKCDNCSSSMVTINEVCAPQDAGVPDNECVPPYKNLWECFSSCDQCPKTHPACVYSSLLKNYCCYESTKVGKLCTIDNSGDDGVCSEQGNCVSGAKACCLNCECSCLDFPCPLTINSSFDQIKANYTEINVSNQNIKSLTEEKVEPTFRISEIFKNLKICHKELEPCFTSKEEQRRVEREEEKIIWYDLYSCSNLKEYLGYQVNFYNKSGQKIKDCYGSSPVEPGLLDNFFCCKYETF